MARDEKKAEETGERREYWYAKCATCHTKVNINAYWCPRCKNRVTWNANRGEWETQVIHASRNPDDRIYELQLCRVERCMVCETALLGNPCRYAFCYGIGRGRCGLCGKFEPVRYACCQERQRENAAGAIRNDPSGEGGDGQ
jgi:hypothetical protein